MPTDDYLKQNSTFTVTRYVFCIIAINPKTKPYHYWIMMKLLSLIFFLLFSALTLSAQTDIAGATDYSGLPRVTSHYYISEFSDSDESSFDFATGKETSETVKGKKFHFEYLHKKGTPIAPKTVLFTHYINKVKALKGTLVFEDLNDNVATFKIPKDGKEIWVSVSIYEGGTNYTVTVVEP